MQHILTIYKSRCPALSNTTHHNPGQALAESLLVWLTDGAPMPESGQSKCDGQRPLFEHRVRAAREATGLDTDSVKTLMQSYFSRTSPKQLTSEQVDELIGLIQNLGNHHVGVS
ncbi:hypothetical protein DO97_05580 [Neosynechococcus sphagnicola sy1]|uniref:Uncharacterized protein n=1 Tax=Neosynechococcus sphagnicola sy1 TaxID=1497020 RepID=A0A098TSV1_9CYAN|nr:hypothetical protein [Neosynechococcus sphagnicola]KGF73853.1 hypothetical protein DO97_05580 [Neosynechococcus sphagnicola sy1]